MTTQAQLKHRTALVAQQLARRTAKPIPWRFNGRDYKTVAGLCRAVRAATVGVDCGFDQRKRFYIEWENGDREYASIWCFPEYFAIKF